MSPANKPETEPLTQEQADAEEIMRLVFEGQRVTDPELRRRVHERAERVRQGMLRRFGGTNIAVEMIRETRDE